MKNMREVATFIYFSINYIGKTIVFKYKLNPVKL